MSPALWATRGKGLSQHRLSSSHSAAEGSERGGRSDASSPRDYIDKGGAISVPERLLTLVFCLTAVIPVAVTACEARSPRLRSPSASRRPHPRRRRPRGRWPRRRRRRRLGRPPGRPLALWSDRVRSARTSARERPYRALRAVLAAPPTPVLCLFGCARGGAGPLRRYRPGRAAAHTAPKAGTSAVRATCRPGARASSSVSPA